MSDEHAAARGALSFGDAIYEMVSLRAATALITSKESLKGPHEHCAGFRFDAQGDISCTGWHWRRWQESMRSSRIASSP